MARIYLLLQGSKNIFRANNRYMRRTGQWFSAPYNWHDIAFADFWKILSLFLKFVHCALHICLVFPFGFSKEKEG